MFTGTRSRLLLIGLVLLAVGAIALSWFLGVAPQLQAMERAKADTAQEKSLNDIEQIAVNALRVQNESLDDLKAELQGFQRGIPQAQQQPELLRLLTSAASSTGVTLTRAGSGEILAYLPPAWQQPAPNTGEGRLVGLTLEIEAEGETANLRDYVARLQSLERYVTVASVAFTTGEDGTKVRINGTAWVLISAEAAAANSAVDAPAAPAAPADAETTPREEE